MTTSSDAIVIGGGAIGLAVAWRASEQGLDVTLVDPRIGTQASTVAAGMLAPVTEVHYGEEPLLQLNLASADLYPAWIAHLEDTTGCSTGYVQCSTVLVARDADDRQALDHLFRFQQALQLDVERLTGSQLRELEPGCAATTRGGVLVKGDHQVDPGALVGALRKACELSGVRMISASTERVVMKGARVTGVDLDSGERLDSECVVVAAGAASADISGIPDGLLPIRPVKGQVVHLRARMEPPPISHNVRGLDVYLVPRPDGRLVIGATMEERAWDDRPTAGAVHDLLRYGYELVPGITEMDFEGARVGFRPGTPDNAPILGPTQVDGLIAATGHFRNGILLTPVTADAIAELLVTGRTRDDILPFAADRFRGAA